MANQTIYTSQNITFGLSNIQTASEMHLKYAYYYADQKLANISTGANYSYTAVPGTAVEDVSYTLNNVQNLPTDKTSITYNIFTYAVWGRDDWAGFSNIGTGTLQVNQAAIYKSAKFDNATIWVNGTAQLSYEFTQTPFNTGTNYTKTGSATTLTSISGKCSVTGVKTGTDTVTLTAADPVQNTTTAGISVIQQVTAVNVSTNEITINKGANATFYASVSALNTNDSNATTNIFSNTVTTSFTGTSTGQTSVSSLVKNTSSTPTASTGTTITLSGVTKAGVYTITSADGYSTEASNTVTIYLSDGIYAYIYNNSACTSQITTGKVNSGDAIWVKVYGGTGNGTLSVSNTAGTFSTTTVSTNGGVSRLELARKTTQTDFTISVAPADGGTSYTTGSFTIYPVTITLG